MRILKQAQLECEDVCINTREPEFRVLDTPSMGEPEPEAAPELEEET